MRALARVFASRRAVRGRAARGPLGAAAARARRADRAAPGPLPGWTRDARPASRSRAELPRLVAGAVSAARARRSSAGSGARCATCRPTSGAAEVPVARDYRRAAGRHGAEILALFDQRVSDYAATVRWVAADEVGAAVAAACRELGLRRVVVPPAAARAWRPDGGRGRGRRRALGGGARRHRRRAHGMRGGDRRDRDARARRPRAVRPAGARRSCPTTTSASSSAEQVVGSVPEAIARLEAAVASSARR